VRKAITSDLVVEVLVHVLVLCTTVVEIPTTVLQGHRVGVLGVTMVCLAAVVMEIERNVHVNLRVVQRVKRDQLDHVLLVLLGNTKDQIHFLVTVVQIALRVSTKIKMECQIVNHVAVDNIKDPTVNRHVEIVVKVNIKIQEDKLVVKIARRGNMRIKIVGQAAKVVLLGNGRTMAGCPPAKCVPQVNIRIKQNELVVKIVLLANSKM
jgi:hypothetical protein